MPVTYTLIASNTLSSAAASVTFSAIPSTYTDLVLRGTARDEGANVFVTNIFVQYNITSGTKYSRTELYAYSTTPASDRQTNQNDMSMGFIPRNNATANTFGSFEIYVPSYASSQNKVTSMFSVAEANSSTNIEWGIAADAGLLRDTTAISTIKLSVGTNFVSGSSFFLYGIKNS